MDRTHAEAARLAPSCKLVLPGERVAHDSVEAVEFWNPVERLADAICGCDRDHDIARTAAAELHRKLAPVVALDRIEHLAHRIAAAVAAVQGHAPVAGAQIVQRRAMRAGEVADMDEVADAGAVRRVVVGAVDVDMRSRGRALLRPRP